MSPVTVVRTTMTRSKQLLRRSRTKKMSMKRISSTTMRRNKTNKRKRKALILQR